MTLEGEVVERTGAITGGGSAPGEALSLRRRLDEAETEERALAREAQALRERLSAFPTPGPWRSQARLLSLGPVTLPRAQAPRPPEPAGAQGLRALRRKGELTHYRATPPAQ